MTGLYKYLAKIAFNLHFLSHRFIVTVIVQMLVIASLSAQEPVRPDTLIRPEMELPPDTAKAPGAITVSPDAVDMPITYKAEGYMKTDLRSKKVSLVDKAQVNYGTIELTADSIVLDM